MTTFLLKLARSYVKTDIKTDNGKRTADDSGVVSYDHSVLFWDNVIPAHEVVDTAEP